MRRVILRLWQAVRPSAGEADLTREIASHLQLLEDDFQRRGMPAEEARLAARRMLGGELRAKDLHRDARSFIWLDDLRRDTSHALRLLRRNTVFMLTAALSLAIGIGANTTVFTIANALLFRDPPGVVDPARLVDIGRTDARSGFNNISYKDTEDIRQRTTTLESTYV